MKKSLIAASASAVTLAAIPVVGVFAVDTLIPANQTDILTISLDKVCAFGYSTGDTINVTGVAHTPTDTATADEGTWTIGTPDPGTGDRIDTLAKTMVNGTSSANLGTTTLGIYCNNHNGYQISSAFTNGQGATVTGDTAGRLVGAVSGEYIPAGALTVNNETISTADSSWAYKVANKSGATNVGTVQAGFNDWTGNAGTIVSSASSTPSKMTTNTGDYFTITYGVAIDQAQAADTYTGGIKYTLAQLNN